MDEIGLRTPRSMLAETMDEAEAACDGARPPARRSARRTRSAAAAAASPTTTTSFVRICEQGLRAQPDLAGAPRGVGRRLARVRARGHARPRRQRRHHLLHREHRPHGRAHRRQRHRRAGAHAHRRPVPGACATPAKAIIRKIGVDTGGSNVQFAVNPDTRRSRRHRDEPARLALLGPRLQGHGLPDRQDRRQAGRRLHARRDRQRHHPQDAGVLRAHASTTWS